MRLIGRRGLVAGLALGLLGAVLAAGGAGAQDRVLRLALLQVGTVTWEAETIRAEGLDTARGFRLEVLPMAGEQAARVAFQAGGADTMVADFIWVARQRAAGRDYVFVPYSRAVGGLMVPADSPATSLSDLAGSTIGIAGGPLDKSWLILRAYALQQEGFDLAAGTDQVFAAPPLIFRQARSGALGGAVNFWHFMARMRAAGLRELVSVSDAAGALGLDPQTPLLGYVFRGEDLRARPELVRGMMAASRAAKDLLAQSDAPWERLRPLMNAADDAEFAALREGFRAGIPAPGPVDEAAAGRLLSLMADLGGADLVGPDLAGAGPDAGPRLPPGLFVQPGI
ncbi:ABC transporter substrate-binding protein (plasmid) [Paroceanicella profunda]|uniref:ABC transporter substrate-binding protein n=1 Tax=Paroceanicella profunda TaxID=2579971 RepID=A0A5B8G4L3_9RHOB|nr:ABC transporter substrate-binding protein [Paroceanicella profunda]QDL93893.1 ABC transporter substrate-binding protein [Paroceanicella profunda]